MSYDVFISYSSVQRPWATTLAANLQGAGKKVFLDHWLLKPGSRWMEALDAAIETSAAAILVVSPEAIESGWVKDEYEKLKRRQNAGADFTVIPVIHSKVETEFPFLGNIHCVDFRQPTDYRTAFAKVLAGLDGRAPGPSPSYDGALEFPLDAPVLAAADAPDKLQRLHEAVLTARAVQVLVRGGVSVAEIAKDVQSRASYLMGSDCVARVGLPYAQGDGNGSLFCIVAEAIGFGSDIDSADRLEAALAQRLAEGRGLVLVVTGFENASSEDQRRLSAILRGLDSRFDNLKVVLFGSQRLNELKYGDGLNSLLSHAEEVNWPDPEIGAIAELAAGEGPPFSPEEITAVDAAAGGHPAVSKELFLDIRRGEVTIEALPEMVATSPAVWSVLSPLVRQDGALEQLSQLAGRTAFGLDVPFQPDPILRRLRWEGLLTRHPPRRLVWRSEAIRQAVRDFVGAYG